MTVVHISSILIGLFSMIFISNCGKYLPWSDGPENEIQIFVSQNDIQVAEELMEKSLFRQSVDVNPESYFTLRYRDPSKFDELQNRHNIVVFAVTDSKNDNGDHLINQLIADGELGTYAGEDPVWVEEDIFSLGQVIAIIRGNHDDISSSLKLKGDWLFDQFDKRYLKRISDHLYEINEQTDISEEIFNRYGWTVRVPHDFMIVQEDRPANFVKLGRDYPRRWFTVHWIDNQVGSELHRNSVKNSIRNLAKRFFSDYQFIESGDRPWTINKINIDNREMWRVEGRWETKSANASGGGPFISYIFYDESTKRLFHLNMLLFNPAGKKLFFLREMESMVRTFSINYKKPSRISLRTIVLIASSIIMVFVFWSLWSTWKRQKRLTQSKMEKAKLSY
jgi:hypothetical protein